MRSQKGHLLIDVRFTFVKELTLDVSNVLAPPKQKSSSVQKEKAPPVESPTTASSPKVDVKSKKPQSTDAKVVENGVAYDKNEDESAKSAPNSPFASSTVGSPSREFQILTMERQQTQMPHPVIRNLKVMIMRVLGLCFLATMVAMNQHGGHLTLMMMLTRCGVSMHLVPPRYGHMQTRGRLDSLVRQSFTMPLDLSRWHKVRENLRQKW